jgi:hypothetical protein
VGCPEIKPGHVGRSDAGKSFCLLPLLHRVG